MFTPSQGSPRLRVVLSTLAIASITSLAALAPSVSMAAEPIQREPGAAMETNELEMHRMMEAHHANLHEKMGTDCGDMHQAMPMTGGMPMTGRMPMHGMSHTGDVDQDFAANMRRHHEMGLRMAQAQIKDGQDPEMIRLARDLVEEQETEISALDRWLMAHELAAPKSE